MVISGWSCAVGMRARKNLSPPLVIGSPSEKSTRAGFCHLASTSRARRMPGAHGILENGRRRRPGRFFVVYELFAFPKGMQKAHTQQKISSAEVCLCMDAAIAPMVTKTPHYQSNAAFKKGA